MIAMFMHSGRATGLSPLKDTGLMKIPIYEISHDIDSCDNSVIYKILEA
jgi:hypothetical protein